MRRRAASVLCPVVVLGLLAIPAGPASGAKPPVPSGKTTPAAYMRTHDTRPVAVGRTSNVSSAAPAATPELDPQAAQQPTTAQGTVRVAVTGDAGAVSTSALRLGGRVLASAGGTSSVLLPKDQLRALASAPGISAVDAAERPYALVAPTSEGVAASGADVWHNASEAGAGVHIAIVDVGFGTSESEYSAAVTAGDLGTSPNITNETCTDGSNSSTPYVDGHGLAVAELAHQEAPGAVLDLFCIGDITGLINSEAAIEAANIRIASSSLGWFGDSRGDGTGPTQSAAAVVEKARRAGVLWIQSAGNEAASHWGRVMGDADHDHVLDINGTFDLANHIYEDDFIYVRPDTGNPTDATVHLQWDQWPTTTAPVALRLYGYQCNDIFARLPTVTTAARPRRSTPMSTTTRRRCRAVTRRAPSRRMPCAPRRTSVRSIRCGRSSRPTAAPSRRCATTSTTPAIWTASRTTNARRSSATTASCRPTVTATASPRRPTRRTRSPWVLPMSGPTGRRGDTLESFSSQGPTIDSRVKPDITGWDGVSSAVFGLPSAGHGFYGTSAAAPGVAGAAALVAAANPAFDAAQIQSFLERRAGHGSPNTPPTNATGHGLLTLGPATDITEPAGANYTPITPTRILDTRNATGGHHAVLTAGTTVTFGVTPDVPADATAVAINLTGTGATASTFLSAFAGGTSFPGTSNLNLSPIDRTAAVFAVVGLGAAKSIAVRNSGGTVNVVVDELGYFSPGTGTGRYTGLPAPHRVLDTRTATGGHHAKLGSAGTVTVDPAVPAEATAAIVNVTVVGGTSGFVSAAPTCSHTSSTLNYGRYVRANLAAVKLDGSGEFCISNGGSLVDVIVDVLGYMSDTGALYYALPSAERIVDTRTGNGGSAGGAASRPFGPAVTTSFYGSNVGRVPASAKALLTGVVEASATSGSYLSFFPGATQPASPTSTMNFTAGRVVANATIVGLSLNRFAIYNSGGSTNAAVDLFGYFK